MGNQYSSLKNETVIFIIPHTINTITIHVFKILYSIVPNYVQNSFDCNGVSVAILISILIFWFSPTKRCTNCNTYRYPYWFICGGKNCCPYRSANTNPISSIVRVFKFIVHIYSTVTLFAKFLG